MRLVIFDLDGTLIDSQDMIVEALRQTFVAHKLTPPDRTRALSIVGLSLDEAFVALAGPDAPIARLSQRYKEAFNALRREDVYKEPFFPGALDGVARLRSMSDVLLGIATGKSRKGVAYLLERAGWQNAFATVQTADDHPSKPAPDMILAALAETGVAPERAIMVGDTAFDMSMARQAGVGAIGVGWGYHAIDALAQAGAREILADFSELDALVARL